ncbi:FUSC family protein, partial [Pseudomonas aeruginosa]|uniref:FUSC family protein n=1 Tax=Pseudomonas aeruginosa TaxID=287 RepID=UPI0031B6F217
QEMRLVLLALCEHDNASPKLKASSTPPLMVGDAFDNPAYIQFSLKTLLAALLCYLFYTASDWQGAHTIMLTCLIVAQPSLGATGQRSLLRVVGAWLGGSLA